MKINWDFLDNNLESVVKCFEVDNFNNLSVNDKKEIIYELSNLIANCFNEDIEKNIIFFVDKKILDPGSAMYDFYNNRIMLNKEFITSNLDYDKIPFLIDDIIHETIHYCQNKKGLYIDDLKLTLPFPYNGLQNHESQAYDLAFQILNKCGDFLSFKMNSTINFISQLSRDIYINSIEDLMSRGYDIRPTSIENQINTVMPYYQNADEILKLEDANRLSLITDKNKQEIKMAQALNGNIYGLIKIKENDNIDKLSFAIINDTCIINDISKMHPNTTLSTVLYNNKRNLINILYKIIETGNTNGHFECDKFNINPISVVDNKKEYERFIKSIENKKIRTLPFNDNIGEKQIKKDIFDNMMKRNDNIYK